MQKSFLFVLCFFVFGPALPVRGCDLCGCYTPQIEARPLNRGPLHPGQPTAEIASGRSIPLYFAIAEQFTHFGTVQFEGREVPNPTDQFLNSSITQLVAGYTITPRLSLQVNVPIIYRSFERPEGFTIDRGTEAGLGDVSLLANFVVWHKETGGDREFRKDDPKNAQVEIREPTLTFSALLTGGVKFPTGGTSRLKEEFNEIEIEDAPESGIHGHDLTLGTGSYDSILGAQAALRYRSFFFSADAQFTLRGDGAHEYHFANDFTWGGGPGYYFVRTQSVIAGLQFVCSGEHKDVDRFRGAPAEDTGITSVFLGPRMVASFGRFSGELAAELPISINNTALQAVPDYRLHASLSVHF